VARVLAQRTERSVHVESDLFFRFVVNGYVEPWKPGSHEQNATVMSIVGEAAVGYARAGYRTVVDGIVIPGWFFEPMRDSIRAGGLAVDYAVLRVPLATALARAMSRTSPELRDSAVVEKIWHDFSDLGDLERHAVDTGMLTAEETADLITELRAAEALAA
jgi:hypothetical protein